jgi:sigma-B regulation protein RsbU (phosphoserine phosphatase)
MKTSRSDSSHSGGPDQGLPGKAAPVPAPAAGVPAAVAALEQARVLALLYEIGAELTSILDLEALMRAIGTRVKRLVDYDLFNVMLLNPATQRLEHAFSLKYDEHVEVTQTLVLGQGLCGTAALERRPIRVERVAEDPRYVLCEIAGGVQSELAVPLLVQDRVLGVLDLESLRPQAFTQDHEQMLSILASTAAIALENARLYDQLRRAEQRKKQDLDRAREVQQLLLPKEMPAVPGLDIATVYLPAQELGGDFYDFLHYRDGRLAIAIGDVSGKGPAAALLASLGVGILREHAVHQPSPPAEMLADLNGHLQILGGNGRFIAMAFGVYDPVKAELCLANAGFPPPLMVRDQRTIPLEVAGVPLGLLPDSAYEVIRLQLQPGDTVVFCSDGIQEQTNAAEEEFGNERLMSRLASSCATSSAAQIAAEILKALDDYAAGVAGREHGDDRTIIVLRVTNGA